MSTYQPSCSACRSNSTNVFFKACQGCQVRRAKAMEAWHKEEGWPAQPAPSVDTERTAT